MSIVVAALADAAYVLIVGGATVLIAVVGIVLIDRWID